MLIIVNGIGMKDSSTSVISSCIIIYGIVFPYRNAVIVAFHIASNNHFRKSKQTWKLFSIMLLMLFDIFRGVHIIAVLHAFVIDIWVKKSLNVLYPLFSSWCFEKYNANKIIENSRSRHESIICQVALVQYNFSPILGTWPTLACLWTFQNFFLTHSMYTSVCVCMRARVSFISTSYFHRISLGIFALSRETKVLFPKDESPFVVSICHCSATMNFLKLFSPCLRLKLHFWSRYTFNLDGCKSIACKSIIIYLSATINK